MLSFGRLTSLLLLSFSVSAQAGIGFTNLTSSDFDKISKEFSGNFSHTSVTGAGTLGTLFGFEVGLVGGLTSSPEIDSIVSRSLPGESLANLYHGGVLGALSIPFGLTGEILLIPTMKASDASFQMTSLALKWTMSESVLILPVNVAVRGFLSSSDFEFKQSSGGIDGTVKNKNSVTGLQLLVSPNLPFVEPYAGVGFLSGKNSLSLSGTGTIFDTSLTTGQSADSTNSSTQLLLGVNLRLLVSVGLEYARSFDTSRYTGKVGFSF
jgi:hypothetical protein